MNFPTLTRRWGTWGDLLSLQDEMNRLFEAGMGSTPRAGLLGSDYVPPVDVVRENDSIRVKVDLPGLKKEDVDLTVINDRLIIRGEKKEESKSEGKNVHRLERFYGSFERVIDLPNQIDAEKITATFNDGVLEIAAPLREEAKPRQIAIEVH